MIASQIIVYFSILFQSEQISSFVQLVSFITLIYFNLGFLTAFLYILYAHCFPSRFRVRVVVRTLQMLSFIKEEEVKAMASSS